MYGKIFASIYNGTLAENWKALVTFQQLIVLSDADGIIDMTHGAISRRTGIPVEIITEGIQFLEKPDKNSRSPDDEGRRIRRLDDHREWGWYLVNHEKYKKMRTLEEKREGNRERKRRQREKAMSRDVTPGHAMSRDVTPGHAMSRHIDIDIDTDTDSSSSDSCKYKNSSSSCNYSASGEADRSSSDSSPALFSLEVQEEVPRRLEGGQKKSPYTQEFEEFWKRVPAEMRRCGKKPAFKAFKVVKKAGKLADAEAGLDRYIAFIESEIKLKGERARPWKGIAPWLNAEMWESDWTVRFSDAERQRELEATFGKRQAAHIDALFDDLEEA